MLHASKTAPNTQNAQPWVISNKPAKYEANLTSVCTMRGTETKQRFPNFPN